MTPDSTEKQIALSSEIADSAIHYEFDLVKLELLSHWENTTFKLSTNKGNFLLCVHRGVHCTIEDIECEAKIIEHLRSYNDYTYQKPMRNRSGNFVSIGSASGSSKPVSILSWIDYPPIDSHNSDLNVFVKLGQLIAHIHNKLSQWQKPRDFKRPALDANGLTGRNGALGYAPLGYSYLDRETANDFQSIHNRLLDIEATIGQNPNVFGLIHGDLHLGNALYDGHSIIPIDFDDLGWGYYVYDLAVPLARYWATSDYLVIKTNLLEGYRSHKELSLEIEKQLPLFIAARCVLGALWLAGRSATNPAVRQVTSQRIQVNARKVKDILINSSHLQK